MKSNPGAPTTDAFPSKTPPKAWSTTHLIFSSIPRSKSARKSTCASSSVCLRDATNQTSASSTAMRSRSDSAATGSLKICRMRNRSPSPAMRAPPNLPRAKTAPPQSEANSPLKSISSSSSNRAFRTTRTTRPASSSSEDRTSSRLERTRPQSVLQSRTASARCTTVCSRSKRRKSRFP